MKSLAIILKIGVWLIGTSLWFILISASFSDYIARTQLTEALSLVAGQKRAVIDFYERNGRCPTNAILNKPADQISGKYVKSVRLVKYQEDACYIVATMRDDAARWVRGKHIMYVLTKLQPYEVSCQTDITQFAVACSKNERL